MTEDEECAGKVVAHSITPDVLERFEADEFEHALLACEKSLTPTVTSGLPPTGSITVHVLVPRPCITIGDPPDQALQEIFHTELCAEAGITIGELKESIEKHENIPAREQTIIRRYAGDRKVPPPDDMDWSLPNSLELVQDCCLEVLVLDAEAECACGKRKLESFDEKSVASCSHADKIVKKQRISLHQHKKAAHRENAGGSIVEIEITSDMCSDPADAAA